MIESVLTTNNQTQPWITATSEESVELSSIVYETSPRIVLPMPEVNRVLGGGLVNGSLLLVGGDPGIGKSTLLLQLSAAMAKIAGPVIYVSGEESHQQIKLRADRLGIIGDRLNVMAETNILAILDGLYQKLPSLVVIDSIQSIGFPDHPSGPGSINQVRECGLALLRWAKTTGTPTFIAGHVTKDGNIAGPKTLEHMVDVVLYMEGASLGSYRLLRSEKNRFGSTNEVAIFDMKDSGLSEISNPSELALGSRTNNVVGCTVTPVIEGTRPLLVEIQSLTTRSTLPSPRRVANGTDHGRLLMIIAVLMKRAGVNLVDQDIIVNVAGGFRATEPSSDLAMAIALTSSLANIPIAPDIAMVGEIGLGGELRSITQMPRRLHELEQMGFDRCIGPDLAFESLTTDHKIELLGARDLTEALSIAFPRGLND